MKTKSEVKHSSLAGIFRIGFKPWIVETLDGVIVLNCSAIVPDDPDDLKAIAFAKLIIRAVNSHEGLLEIVKKLTDKIDRHFYSLPENNENDGKEWKRLYNRACEEIEKAEGK